MSVEGAWVRGAGSFQGFSDRVRHGDVDVVFQVVPIDGKSAVLASRWVDGDGVIITE